MGFNIGYITLDRGLTLNFLAVYRSHKFSGNEENFKLKLPLL